MFSKPQIASDVTVLAQGSALEGSIRTRGPLHIDGAVVGSLSCEGAMSVGASGRVLGELRAQSLASNGRVAGIIVVQHDLQVGEQGVLCGHARYETLEIVRGGRVEGTTTRVSGVPTLVDTDEDDL